MKFAEAAPAREYRYINQLTRAAVAGILSRYIALNKSHFTLFFIESGTCSSGFQGMLILTVPQILFAVSRIQFVWKSLSLSLFRSILAIEPALDFNAQTIRSCNLLKD